MDKWQYHIVEWKSSSGWAGMRGRGGLDQMLTQFGDDGWQLVQVLGEMNAELTFFFKQPRRDET